MDWSRWYTEYTTTAIRFRVVLGVVLVVMLLKTYIDNQVIARRYKTKEVTMCPLCGKRFPKHQGQKFCMECRKRMYIRKQKESKLKK